MDYTWYTRYWIPGHIVSMYCQNQVLITSDKLVNAISGCDHKNTWIKENNTFRLFGILGYSASEVDIVSILEYKGFATTNVPPTRTSPKGLAPSNINSLVWKRCLSKGPLDLHHLESRFCFFIVDFPFKLLISALECRRGLNLLSVF